MKNINIDYDEEIWRLTPSHDGGLRPLSWCSMSNLYHGNSIYHNMSNTI